MNKRKALDTLRLCGAIVFAWLYIPHLAFYAMGGEIVDKQRFEAI